MARALSYEDYENCIPKEDREAYVQTSSARNNRPEYGYSISNSMNSASDPDLVVDTSDDEDDL